MLHNEDVYPDPFTFNPDRFIGKDGNIDKSTRDPAHACWGFGRRYVRFEELKSCLCDAEPFLASALGDTWPFPLYGLHWPLYLRHLISRKLPMRMEM
jgi:hypothetical protein